MKFKLIVLLILVVLSTSSAFYAASFMEEQNVSAEPESSKISVTNSVKPHYTLKIYNEKLAAFYSTDSTPFQYYEANLKTLPSADLAALEKGIQVNTMEELLKYVEDFTS